MYVDDLYLENIDIIKKFDLRRHELEMFVMAMIYGNELSKLPYQYVEKKGVFCAQKIWNKIEDVLNLDENVLKCVNNLISENGILNLYGKEAFFELAKYLNSKYCEVEPKFQDGRYVDVVTKCHSLSEFYKELLELVKEDAPIEIATANSCYNYSDFEFEGKRYKYTFKTKEHFFDKKYNGYFDDLFVQYHKVDFASEEDKQKYEGWQERMKKYEEVKDMVDHAPKMPEINYVYREYIRPTKYCLELLETYKLLIENEDSSTANEGFVTINPFDELLKDVSDSNVLENIPSKEEYENDDLDDEEEWED